MTRRRRQREAGSPVRSSRRYPAERALFQLLAWIFLRRGGRLHVEGLEHLPRTGAVMVVANHVATMDPPLVGTLVPRHDVHYMAKAEAFRWRLARFVLTGFNAFPVVRRSADRRALGRGLSILAEGHTLVMFPEGSRSPDGRLARAFSGVGMLARRSGAPVVCAAVWGSESVLPKGSRWPRKGHVHVRYGAPFTLSKRGPDGRQLSSDAATDLIMRRLAALLPESYRGAYAPAASGLPSAAPPAPSPAA